MIFFSSPVSFTNKNDRHDVNDILLKMRLNTPHPPSRSIHVVVQNMYLYSPNT